MALQPFLKLLCATRRVHRANACVRACVFDVSLVQFKQLVKDTRERMAATADGEDEGEGEGAANPANESVDAPVVE